MTAPVLTVTLDIAPSATGCTPRLTHEMACEWAAYEQQTRKGWGTILDSLGRVMENDDA